MGELHKKKKKKKLARLETRTSKFAKLILAYEGSLMWSLQMNSKRESLNYLCKSNHLHFIYKNVKANIYIFGNWKPCSFHLVYL